MRPWRQEEKEWGVGGGTTTSRRSWSGSERFLTTGRVHVQELAKNGLDDGADNHGQYYVCFGQYYVRG